MRRLFALDQNFPQPIVDALIEYIIEATDGAAPCWR
jgi:hypothetical protein